MKRTRVRPRFKHRGHPGTGLLVEIGTEELPPGFQKNLLNAQAEVVGRLTRKGIILKNPELFVTVRRIALYSDAVEPDLNILEAEVVGPPFRSAFAENGTPTSAALGFASKIGRDISELYRVQKGDREYIAGRQKWRGTLKGLLETILPEWIAGLADFAEKRMRWGTVSVEFVRPVRWICALLGKDRLDFGFARVKSGSTTRGHRWARTTPIRLASAKDYWRVMRSAFVDLELTKMGALDQIAAQQFGRAGSWSYHPHLPMMMEYASLGVSRIPDRFMTLPERLLETVLLDQMKCLLERDATGRLTGRFAFTIDRPPQFYDEETVRAGYDRLAEARLTDACYFYDRDICVPFEDWSEKLNDIVFLEGIGSLADKVKWLEQLWLETQDSFPADADREVIRWTIRLCRNDQPTRMVREFTNLEGEVGKFYIEDPRVKTEVPEALRQRVAQGIKDSYLPRGADDPLPETLEGAIVSALEKILTLVVYFLTNERPSGSSDPLGFRRVAIGLIRTLDMLPFDLNLAQVLRVGARQRGLQDQGVSELRSFFEERWEGWVREVYRLEHDICEAVRDTVTVFPRRARRHAVWLSERVQRWQSGQDAHFGEVVRIVTRVHNLAREAVTSEAPSVEAFCEPEEREMYEKIYALVPGLPTDDVSDLSALDELCAWLNPSRIAIIDRFFDRVLVMHEDERIRRNRLNLIYGIDRTLSRLGALWKLERG
ncbi:MAG: glycine--tRNA ligase subunit beta [bacterium JZ-2024 1]